MKRSRSVIILTYCLSNSLYSFAEENLHTPSTSIEDPAKFACEIDSKTGSMIGEKLELCKLFCKATPHFDGNQFNKSVSKSLDLNPMIDSNFLVPFQKLKEQFASKEAPITMASIDKINHAYSKGLKKQVENWNAEIIQLEKEIEILNQKFPDSEKKLKASEIDLKTANTSWGIMPQLSKSKDPIGAQKKCQLSYDSLKSEIVNKKIRIENIKKEKSKLKNIFETLNPSLAKLSIEEMIKRNPLKLKNLASEDFFFTAGSNEFSISTKNKINAYRIDILGKSGEYELACDDSKSHAFKSETPLMAEFKDPHGEPDMDEIQEMFNKYKPKSALAATQLGEWILDSYVAQNPNLESSRLDQYIYYVQKAVLDSEFRRIHQLPFKNERGNINGYHPINASRKNVPPEYLPTFNKNVAFFENVKQPYLNFVSRNLDRLIEFNQIYDNEAKLSPADWKAKKLKEFSQGPDFEDSITCEE